MKQSVPRVRVKSWKEPQESVDKATGERNSLDTSVGSALVSPSASGGVPPRRGTQEMLKAYQTMPWLRAVTNKIGTSVGATHWKLFVPKEQGTGRPRRNKQMQRAGFDNRQKLFTKERKRGDLEEFDDHPLLDLLHTGNPKLQGQTVFQLTQQHLDLVGEAFWILERNFIGTPIAVWPLPPDWISEFPTDQNPWFRVQIGSQRYSVPVTEIIPFIDPDPANPYGRGSGIAQALGDELETDEFIAQHLKGFFYNRARPDIIVSADNLSRSDTQRLEERWKDEHQGFWRSFKPQFINRKVDVQELGQSFENMQLIELRKHERDTILQVFGLPAEKFGVLSSSNRSTILSADVFWTKDVIMPRVEMIRNTLQDRLVPMFDERLVLDFESPVAEDKEHQLEVMRSKPGAFTINEWRREAQLESLGEIGEAFVRQEQDVQVPVDQSNEVPRPASGGPALNNQEADLDVLCEKLMPAIKQQIKKRRKEKRAQND